MVKRIRSLSILKYINKRGTRSGKQTRIKAQKKAFKIPAIITNRIEQTYANSKYQRYFRVQNQGNLINVRPEFKDSSIIKNKEFVPGLIVSNVMSLAPKMDELKTFISTPETTTDII